MSTDSTYREGLILRALAILLHERVLVQKPSTLLDMAAKIEIELAGETQAEVVEP